MTTAHDFTVSLMNGTEKSLKEFAGKVVLLVNVASRCGYTKQYKGLEALWREQKDKGLVVVGVPCNQFGAQEPGTEAEIQQFCSTTYDVTFPMTKKVDVNGPQAHPLYAWLTSQTGGKIGWNFEKFVIGKDGTIVKRFEPGTTPEASTLRQVIATALES
jgi:glutathione peroxidase